MAALVRQTEPVSSDADSEVLDYMLQRTNLSGSLVLLVSMYGQHTGSAALSDRAG